MSDVLVLNSDYRVLDVTNLRRAVRLLFAGKAEAVHNGDRSVATVSFAIPLPSIIRMLYYIRTRRQRVALTKKNVLLRDDYVCQYCGCAIDRNAATIDHVVPKSRGGPSTWQNLVAACFRCNGRKGSRRLEDSGMSLRRPPKEPRHIPFVVVRRHTFDSEWAAYLGVYGVSIEERVRG